jgi:imidazolonepropionase-like amidohydrolase
MSRDRGPRFISCQALRPGTRVDDEDGRRGGDHGKVRNAVGGDLVTGQLASVTVRHATVVDPATARARANQVVQVTDGVISAVDDDRGGPAGDGEIDGTAMFAVPGLIDCHVHVMSASVSPEEQCDWYPSYVTARAARNLREMLERGFTTVRDVAGADAGLAAAVAEGLLAGPRLVCGGKALSQTGGHGDARPGGRDPYDPHYFVPALNRICDGVTDVRRAVRDEVRRGASHIKLHASGGCASPTDRLDSVQFSDEELRAIVEEAAAAKLYCAAHAYTAEAVNRALRAGVRTIEHGNMLDETSVRLFIEHEAFYVPTLIAYTALVEDGPASGISEFSLAKARQVYDAGLRALELADRGGVQIAYGSDLLGPLQRRQSEEFRIRADVQKPADVLRGATTVAARVLRMEGQVGTLAPGAHGDLILTRHNPLDDVTRLADPGREVAAVIKAGNIAVDRRAA